MTELTDLERLMKQYKDISPNPTLGEGTNYEKLLKSSYELPVEKVIPEQSIRYSPNTLAEDAGRLVGKPYSNEAVMQTGGDLIRSTGNKIANNPITKDMIKSSGTNLVNTGEELLSKVGSKAVTELGDETISTTARLIEPSLASKILPHAGKLLGRASIAYDVLNSSPVGPKEGSPDYYVENPDKLPNVPFNENELNIKNNYINDLFSNLDKQKEDNRFANPRGFDSAMVDKNNKLTNNPVDNSPLESTAGYDTQIPSLPEQSQPLSESGQLPLTPEELAAMGVQPEQLSLNSSQPEQNFIDNRQAPKDTTLSDIQKVMEEYNRLKGNKSDLNQAATIDALTSFGQDFAKYGALSGQAAAMQASGSKVNTQPLKFKDPGILARAQKVQDNKEKAMQREVELLRARKMTDYQKQTLALKKSTIDSKVKKEGMKLTVAQKAVDKEYGKNYAEQITTGGFTSDKDFGDLTRAMKLLKGKTNISGPIIGNLPDSIRSIIGKEDSVATKDLVAGVVQKNLRKILGGQFAEKEGENLIKRAYNETLSEEENIRRVSDLMTQLNKMGEANKAMAKYYEKNGTISGYKGKKYNPMDVYNFSNNIKKTSQQKAIMYKGIKYSVDEKTGDMTPL